MPHLAPGDVALAIRRLWRAPVFTVSAILLLGVGMGGGTSFFLYFNAFVFAPREVTGDLVRLATSAHSARLPQESVDRVLADPPGAVDPLAGFGASEGNLIVGGVSYPVRFEGVTGPYFELARAKLLAGRLLVRADERPDAMVGVISERLWMLAFDGDELAVGSGVIIGGRQITVVGVVARPFQGAIRSPRATDLWVPSHLLPVDTLFGRLRPGMPLRQADAEVRARYASRDAPDGARAVGVSRGLVPAPPGHVFVAIVSFLGLGLAHAGIAAGSFALLLFARVVSRRRELAIRLALGGTARELTRLLALEMGLIACAATWVAIGIGHALVTFFVGQFVALSGIDLVANLAVDWRVVLYVAGATGGICAVVVSRLGWSIVRLETSGSLAGHGSGGATLRTADTSARLVMLQSAGTTALLLVAVLFARTAASGAGFAHGLDVDHTAVGWMDASAPHGSRDDSTGNEARAVLETARQMPGITHAALASSLPGGATPALPARVGSEETNESRFVNVHYVTSRVLETIGLRPPARPVVR